MRGALYVLAMRPGTAFEPRVTMDGKKPAAHVLALFYQEQTQSPPLDPDPTRWEDFRTILSSVSVR
jgi:hypothetical protein